MKASLELLSVLALATPLLAASSCTFSNALSWPPKTLGGVSTSCNGDAACLGLGLEGQCNSQVLIDGGSCVKKRASQLTCASNESCYVYLDGGLLCLDTKTGIYHDDTGGKGSAITGAYTASDGSVQTITTTPASSSRRPTSTARTTTTQGSGSVSSTRAASSGRVSSSSSASAGAAVTAATSTASTTTSAGAAATTSSGANGQKGASFYGGSLFALIFGAAAVPLIAA